MNVLRPITVTLNYLPIPPALPPLDGAIVIINDTPEVTITSSTTASVRVDFTQRSDVAAVTCSLDPPLVPSRNCKYHAGLRLLGITRVHVWNIIHIFSHGTYIYAGLLVSVVHVSCFPVSIRTSVQ